MERVNLRVDPYGLRTGQEPITTTTPKGEVARHVRWTGLVTGSSPFSEEAARKSPGASYLFCVNFFSSDTVSACRPLSRRAASTRRPPLVDIRAMNPYRRLRGMRFG